MKKVFSLLLAVATIAVVGCVNNPKSAAADTKATECCEETKAATECCEETKAECGEHATEECGGESCCGSCEQ